MLLNLPVFQVQHLLRERCGEPNNKELPLIISNKTNTTGVRKSVSLVTMSLLSTHTVESPPNNAYLCLATQYNAYSTIFFTFKIIILWPLPIFLLLLYYFTIYTRYFSTHTHYMSAVWDAAEQITASSTDNSKLSLWPPRIDMTYSTTSFSRTYFDFQKLRKTFKQHALF